MYVRTSWIHSAHPFLSDAQRLTMAAKSKVQARAEGAEPHQAGSRTHLAVPPGVPWSEQAAQLSWSLRLCEAQTRQLASVDRFIRPGRDLGWSSQLLIPQVQSWYSETFWDWSKSRAGATTHCSARILWCSGCWPLLVFCSVWEVKSDKPKGTILYCTNPKSEERRRSHALEFHC